MVQLPADCLNDILEYLKDDIKTLHSCILVNHLWCEVSIRIFWIDIRNYNTIFACLPNVSKEYLRKIGINIAALSSKKHPIFNYASFCKVLSIDKIYYNIEELFKNQKSMKLVSLRPKFEHVKLIAVQEICSMLMNQSPPLKSLTFLKPTIATFIPFTDYPGARERLRNLTELHCDSNNSNVFFDHLSKICNKILLLDVTIKDYISEELENLISAQKNLKCFSLTQYDELMDVDKFPSLIEKLPKTINKLCLYKTNQISLSFITKFINLQELRLSFELDEDFEDFEILQFEIFPQLQILKIDRALPEIELLTKFLENNGKYLKELYLSDAEGNWNDYSLNLSIAKFCTNLKKLTSGFRKSELKSLKKILNSCEHLESIKIWCSGQYLSEKEALEAVVKHSPENFSELILHHLFRSQSRSFPEELESFFKTWSNRELQKPFSLVIVSNAYCVESLDKFNENVEIIKKYIKLGIIKKFRVANTGDEEYI